MSVDWTFLKRGIESRLSENEKGILKDWLGESPRHAALYEDMKKFIGQREQFTLDEASLQSYRIDFNRRVECSIRKRARRRVFRVILYAAVLMLPVMAGAIWVLFRVPSADQWVTQGEQIYPGTRKARLVIHDGTVIPLDSVSLIMAEYGGTKIKNVGKTLLYADTVSASEAIENTLVTPRGGEYSVVLNDGTHVWLNSDSELRYPVSFKGKVRKVFLSGEAYFEVAHDSVHPFIVVAREVEVKVYGTSFNINTRKGDRVQAILVKGSVGVKAKTAPEVRLHPGEMAVYQKSTGLVTVETVTVENHVAWKHGEFFFVDEPLKNILDELILWYDVEVFYSRAELQEMCFTCYVPRYKEVDEILDLLESTSHVKFKIRGRTIIVE